MNILAANLIIVSLGMDAIRPITVVNVVRMSSMKAIFVRLRIRRIQNELKEKVKEMVL